MNTGVKIDWITGINSAYALVNIPFTLYCSLVVIQKGNNTFEGRLFMERTFMPVITRDSLAQAKLDLEVLLREILWSIASYAASNGGFQNRLKYEDHNYDNNKLHKAELRIAELEYRLHGLSE